MDRDIINAKLESLRRCLGRISAKRPDSAERLAADHDLQDIIAINLERPVQLCVDLAAMLIAEFEWKVPETMAESFELLERKGILSAEIAERMKKAVGFRNISVHTYRKIDWQIVFTIIHKHLDDFEAYARIIDSRTRT